MIKKSVCCVLCALATAMSSLVSLAEEGAGSAVSIEKQLQKKRNELKGLRLRNPSHVLGEETQSTALRKRMPKAGDKKYYASQVVDVRPFCVCEHSSLADGGTTARHSKNHSKRSLDRTSTDYTCSEKLLCPAWKQWRDAMKKVEETKQFNNDIDPILSEIEELESKLKEKMQAIAEERKAKNAEKQKKGGK